MDLKAMCIVLPGLEGNIAMAGKATCLDSPDTFISTPCVWGEGVRGEGLLIRTQDYKEYEDFNMLELSNVCKMPDWGRGVVLLL